MKEKDEIYISPVIIADIKKIIEGFLETANDEAFVTKIIESSLQMGKTTSRGNIEDIIREKYRVVSEEKSKMLTLLYHLSKIIGGQHEITKNEIVVNNISEEEWKDYMSCFRSKVEQEILKIYYPGDYEVQETQEINIVGDIAMQLDNDV